MYCSILFWNQYAGIIIIKLLFKTFILFCDFLHGTLYREAAIRAICYYYYPPCGNSTHFAPPNALCQDVCSYATIGLCSHAWTSVSNILSGAEDLEELQVPFLNCSQPGSFLGSVPHCCSDAGFDTPGEILVETLHVLKRLT